MPLIRFAQKHCFSFISGNVRCMLSLFVTLKIFVFERTVYQCTKEIVILSLQAPHLIITHHMKTETDVFFWEIGWENCGIFYYQKVSPTMEDIPRRTESWHRYWDVAPIFLTAAKTIMFQQFWKNSLWRWYKIMSRIKYQNRQLPNNCCLV